MIIPAAGFLLVSFNDEEKKQGALYISSTAQKLAKVVVVSCGAPPVSATGQPLLGYDWEVNDILLIEKARLIKLEEEDANLHLCKYNDVYGMIGAVVNEPVGCG